MKTDNQRIHRKPRYVKTQPHYVLEIPWVATSGSPKCPCEYNNSLHAALHELVAAMRADEMRVVRTATERAHCLLGAALREAKKPGAMVPQVGQAYPDPDECEDQPKGGRES